MAGSSCGSANKVQLAGIQKRFRINGNYLHVLNDIDMEVDPGAFVSIVGPSGCGKSSLLNILAGLEEPDSGSIRIDGVELPSRLGSIAYMQQKDLLLPWRTVLENATLALEITGMKTSESRTQALAVLDDFGLLGFENQYPNALSGGMRQRASFLRTWLARKSIILLDEPFGALDALTRAALQEWLIRKWELLGTTIIMVTHDVEEAILLSDKVYVLTGRPGSVIQTRTVPFPRPRHYGIVNTKEFIGIKESILDSILSESITGRGVE